MRENSPLLWSLWTLITLVIVGLTWQYLINNSQIVSEQESTYVFPTKLKDWIDKRLAEQSMNYEMGSKIIFRYSNSGFGSNMDGMAGALSYSLLFNKKFVIDQEHEYLWTKKQNCSVVGDTVHTCWFRAFTDCMTSRDQNGRGIIFRKTPDLSLLRTPDSDIAMEFAFPPRNSSWRWEDMVWLSVFCHGFVMQPTHVVLEEVKRQKAVKNIPDRYIAVHIRRGDANYERWHPLSVYVRYARWIADRNEDIDTVVLVTDGRDSIREEMDNSNALYSESWSKRPLRWILYGSETGVKSESLGTNVPLLFARHHEFDIESAAQLVLLSHAEHLIVSVSSFARAAFYIKAYRDENAENIWIIDRFQDGRVPLHPTRAFDMMKYHCDDCGVKECVYCPSNDWGPVMGAELGEVNWEEEEFGKRLIAEGKRDFTRPDIIVADKRQTKRRWNTFPLSPTQSLESLNLEISDLSPDYLVVKDTLNDVSMAVYKSRTTPHFLVSCVLPLWPETSDIEDNMICRSIKNFGRWDMHVAGAIRVLAGEKCAHSRAEKTPLVVDIGANVGFESLYAASFGCRVASFEPDPRCTYLFKHSVKLNGFENLIELHENIVSETDERELILNRNPNHPGNNQVWMGSGNCPDDDHCIAINTSRVDSVVKEDVLLMKIDVEGFEWHVLMGSTALFENCNIENLIVEFVPHALIEISGLVNAGVEILEFMDALGYEARVLRFQEQEHAKYEPDMIVEDVIEPHSFHDFVARVSQGKVESRGYNMVDVWFRKKNAPMVKGVIVHDSG